MTDECCDRGALRGKPHHWISYSSGRQQFCTACGETISTVELCDQRIAKMVKEYARLVAEGPAIPERTADMNCDRCDEKIGGGNEPCNLCTGQARHLCNSCAEDWRTHQIECGIYGLNELVDQANQDAVRQWLDEKVRRNNGDTR